MVIRDTPSAPSEYFMAEEGLVFAIHQAGSCPSYMDNGAVYFKKSNRLEKVLKRLGVVES